MFNADSSFCRPTVLTHDHCYTASPRPLQPVARRDDDRTSPSSPPNPGAKEERSPSPSTRGRKRGQTSPSSPLDASGGKNGPLNPPGSDAAQPGEWQFDGGGDSRRCMLCTIEGDAAPEVRGEGLGLGLGFGLSFGEAFKLE